MAGVRAGRADRADDHLAIGDLYSAYADLMSRRAYAELAEIFLPDTAVVVELPSHTREIRGPEAFGEFVAQRIAHLAFFQFVNLNVLVDLAGDEPHDRASARLHFCELHHDAADGGMRVLHGLYQDGFAKRDDRWWFVRRRFTPLAVVEGGVDVFGYPELDT
jgi:hypothetical protein